MAFECVEMRRPEVAGGGEPGVHLTQRVWLQAIEPALGVDRGLHETGVAQHAEVLGYGRLRHPELPLDLPHRLLGRGEERQDGAPVRFGDDVENGFHALYIPDKAYT